MITRFHRLAALFARDPLPSLPSERFLDIFMDVTNTCNLRCLMFPVDFSAPPRMMSLEVFRKIAEEVVPYARSIMLSCEAEPLMHPRLTDILAIASEFPIPKGMTTNGILLSERIARDLISSGLDSIIVSIDSSSEETFRKIRNASLSKVLSNIEALQRLKAGIGSERPSVGLNFVLMKSNHADIADFPNFARRLGATSVTYIPLDAPFSKHLESEEITGILPRVRDALAEAEENAGRIGIRIFQPYFKTDRTKATARISCGLPLKRIEITSTGDILACNHCRAYRLSAGNISEKSFARIWSGRRMRLFRLASLDVRYNALCRDCKIVKGE